MKAIVEYLKVGSIHVTRINYARLKLSASFPISPDILNNLTEEEFAVLELYISRFSKLQDLLGNKIFSLFLCKLGVNVEQMTLIDKINELEKLMIIDDADTWHIMREMRNHLTHEYPDNPKIVSQYLNVMHELTPNLFQCLERIKIRL